MGMERNIKILSASCLLLAGQSVAADVLVPYIPGASRVLVAAPADADFDIMEADPEAVQPPSAIPAGARAPRRARPHAGKLQVTSGVTADILKDQGARDGFRLMRVADSEGFMISRAPTPAVDSLPGVTPPGKQIVGVRQIQGSIKNEDGTYNVATEYTYSDGTKDVIEDPLVIDLNGDGLRTRERRVLFDIDGDGKRDSINDVSKGDGLLVFDADGDGRAGEDAGEIFGPHARLSGWAGEAPKDGFGALEVLVTLASGEGLIPERSLLARKLTREDLTALEDSWGLRVRLGGLRGRDRRLTEAGIVRLDLAVGEGRRHENYDGRGNDITEATGAQVVMSDGTLRAYGDLWLKKKTGELAPVSR